MAVMLAALLGAPGVAEAQSAGLCLGMQPTNTPTAGDDVIVGTPGDDVLAGGLGDDTIEGGDGNDVLCGNEGDDTILGNTGEYDRIDGGPGNDELGGGEFLPSVTGVRCGLADGSAGEAAVIVNGVAIPARNQVLGGTGDDVISGSWDDDYFNGGDGNDCLMGLNGNDYLKGGNGADFISAGSGEDLALGENDFDDLFGQDGNDKLYAASMNVQVPEWPATCSQSGELPGVYGPAESGTASTSVVQSNLLVGGDGYDRLVGANRVDSMQGDERGDDLYGLGGEDSLRGGRASDCLSGGPDRDTLDDADPQNAQPDDIDTLWGGGSPDKLNTLDGDFLDSLDGGSSIADKCTFDLQVIPTILSDAAISC